MTVNVLKLFQTIAPKAAPNYLGAVQKSAGLLDQRAINTPLRLAHFFAQAMVETGSFTVLRESMIYSAPRIMVVFGVNRHSAAVTEAEAEKLAGDEHGLAERVYGLGNPAKAKELGNTQPGDGFRYRGNGVLQMTGRGAHAKVGQVCSLDFEGNPDLATLADNALKPAVEEWTQSGLNAFADKDDIRTITLRINGGFNGFSDRQTALASIKRVLVASGDLDAASASGQPDDDVKSLQADLNTLGANPRLSEDGHEGPATIAAIRVFQKAAGLTPDGIAGPVTLAAIKLGISARH